MKRTTQAKVIELGRSIVKTIETGIERGLVRPERPDEKPTPDGIRKLVRAVARIYKAGRSVFKTKEQYEMLDAYVYQRLRRDGALRRLRSMTA